MESLNLNTLATSLPTTSLANAEKDLLNSFKAAALSITTLYRSSRQTSKRAYNAGYASACQDLLLMIQQGVSVGGSTSPDGMTIGRVMDWIEARLEAIKSREEEEEEDEEKEKRGGSERTSSKREDGAAKPQKSAWSGARHKGAGSQVASAPHHPDPAAENTNTSTQAIPSSSPAPAPSPSTAPQMPLRQIHPLPHSPLRPLRNRPNTTPKAHSLPVTPSETVFPPPPVILPPSDMHASITELAAGAKRRHAVMMVLDSASSAPSSHATPVITASQADGAGVVHTSGMALTRRRTRSSRGQNQNQHQTDAMDVEEEGGRERKRVARR